MKCFTCNTEMNDVDDIVNQNIRIDWKKCPRCGSVAEVQLHPKDNYPIKIIWKRDE